MDFIKSADFDFVLAGASAAIQTEAAPKIPQFLGKYTNFVVGAAEVAAGLFVKNAKAAAILVGGGFALVLDGAIRILMPDVAALNQPALTTIMSYA